MRVLSVLTYYAPHWTGLTAHARRRPAVVVHHGDLVMPAGVINRFVPAAQSLK